MAEAIARAVVGSTGQDALEFRSAGTSAVPGSPASLGALRVTEENGLNLEDHRSSLLSRELVEWADLVLTMGPAHLQRALELGGEGKSQLLGAFAQGSGMSDGGFAVPDPYGGDSEMYEATFHTLNHYVRQSLRRLEGES